MPGPTGEEDPPTFEGALRFRGVSFEVWAGTNEARVFGGAGAPTWAQVLASGRFTGGVGNNPHIDFGDILSFGDPDTLPSTGTIRSSTDIQMRAAGGLELTSEATMQFATIGDIAMRFVTNNIERLHIGGTGAWRIDGTVGTAGQVLTSNGAGATPTWEDAPGSTPGWDDVLAVDNNSGANNPHIDTGQFIGFGVEGSLPGSGELRSSTAWTANISGTATISSSSVSILSVASSGLVFNASNGTLRFLTGAGVGTERLEIEGTGAWQLGGVVGSAGQVLTSGGAGTPPTWASIPTPALTFEDGGASQGTASIIDVVDAVYTTGSVLVGLGQATMAWDVNLAALVPAIAGTGLENASSTLRIAAAAAGAGLVGGGGSALAVGAGDGIDVAADSVAVDVTDIVDGVSIEEVATNNIRRAAITGAVAIAAGSNASLFAGIRNNGGSTTDRANLNFISSSTLQATLTDDAGNDEIEIAYSILADAVGNTQAANMPANTIKANPTGSSADPQDLAISGDSFPARVGGNLVSHPFSSLAGNSLAYASGALAYAGTSNDVVLNAISGAQGVVDISSLVCGGRVAITAPVGAWSIAGFSAKTEGFWFVLTAASTDFAGTIINSTTANTGIRNPGFVDFSCNRQMSGLVMYGAFGGNSQWLFIPGALDPAELALQVRKPLTVCRWHEDFEFVTTGGITAIFWGGSGTWMAFNAGSAGGNISAQPAETGRIGIVRLTTHNVSNNQMGLYRGSTNTIAPVGVLWIRGDQIKEFNVVARLNDTGSSGFFIGFSEDPSSMAITGTGNSHICGFFFDAIGAFSDTTIHCITRESDGTATDTDTNVAPGTGWRRYTIRQNTVGTIEFLIDGSVVATHNTQVPDSEPLNCGVNLITRHNVAKSMDVDYVDFESQPLAR